jgi:hypothetical protein
VGLRLERAACFVLADPAHGRSAVAEAGGDRGRALALVVELNDALADKQQEWLSQPEFITPRRNYASLFMETPYRAVCAGGHSWWGYTPW